MEALDFCLDTDQKSPCYHQHQDSRQELNLQRGIQRQQQGHPASPLLECQCWPPGSWQPAAAESPSATSGRARRGAPGQPWGEAEEVAEEAPGTGTRKQAVEVIWPELSKITGKIAASQPSQNSCLGPSYLGPSCPRSHFWALRGQSWCRRGLFFS